MFARCFVGSLLILPALAAENSATLTGDSPSQCSVGVPQCCRTTQIITGDSGVQVGEISVDCVNIDELTSPCTTQPVCCTNKSYSGIVASGCNSVPADTASANVITEIVNIISSNF